ncbi:MAG: hypothetical protein FWG88_10715 [Oscillospiraceae bacterium]|nr:hypothetical protein [Oscillospiraceae bacterium]
MARVTPKENFMKLAGGGHPYYVPYFTFMGNEPIPEIPTKSAGAMLFEFNPPNPDGSRTDMWGVTSYPNEATAGSSMPAPDVFVMEDITKWRDILKTPKYRESLDFEQMAKDSFERIGIDRNETALRTGSFFGPWMTIIGLMGFEGAMLAMAEEPEYVKEMFDWMTSLYEPYTEKILDAFQPDIWTISDDICTERGPFFSVDMFRDLYLPYYRRFTKLAVERGLPVMMHICGKIEPFIPDLIDIGVQFVEPAQETNDIMALKELYPGKMSYCGAHDWGKHVPANYPDYDEEAVRQDVRNTIDKYAPGGGFATLIWPVSFVGDPHIDDLKKLVWNEAYEYGKKQYGYSES